MQRENNSLKQTQQEILQHQLKSSVYDGGQSNGTGNTSLGKLQLSLEFWFAVFYCVEEFDWLSVLY